MGADVVLARGVKGEAALIPPQIFKFYQGMKAFWGENTEIVPFEMLISIKKEGLHFRFEPKIEKNFLFKVDFKKTSTNSTLLTSLLKLVSGYATGDHRYFSVKTKLRSYEDQVFFSETFTLRI